MSKLKLFLVTGFLGSGKTTARQKAVVQLHKNKKKVRVITNDQGDNKLMAGYYIPLAEIADGCLCCNYKGL